MAAAHLLGLVAALPAFWRSQLDAALPDALRPSSDGGLVERLLISPDDQVVSIALVGADGREVFVERAKWCDYTRAMLDRCRRRAADLLQSCDVTVSVAIPQAVGRSMLIPRRARDQARHIIRDYISRKTPLPIDEIFIAWDVLPATAGKLNITYIALPKTLLERTFARLHVVSGDITTVEGDVTGAVPLAGPVPARTSGRARLAASCAVLTAVMTLVGFGTLAYRQGTLLSELDRELSHSEVPAKRVAEETRSIRKLGDDLTAIARLRDAPGVGRIWEELASILPATAYLTELDITETGLQLSGFSESAPALIRFLETSAVVRQAVLSGPITFDATKGRDRFSIQASLKAVRTLAGERE